MPLRTFAKGVPGLLALLFAAGCGGGPRHHEGGGAFGPEQALPIPARHTSVVAEGCALDPWQLETLQSSPMQKLVSEVILVCPTIRDTGDVAPLDASARSTLSGVVSSVRALGYEVRLGVTMGDDSDTFPVPYPSTETAAAFASASWQETVSQNLAPFATMADGLEIDLLGMPDSIRSNMTAFFVLLDGTVRKTAPLGLMAPPSTMNPSDTPGGEAFDLAAIGPHVDRVRMMTLDYSSGGGGPGPDIDPSWAASSASFALSQVTVPVDLSFPLYGTDFSALGDRYVTYDEAVGLAQEERARLSNGDRDPASGELSFSWTDDSGNAHQTWFEDGVSASVTLSSWTTGTVPAAVGVVLYGLGGEDPQLWDTLVRGLP